MWLDHVWIQLLMRSVARLHPLFTQGQLGFRLRKWVEFHTSHVRFMLISIVTITCTPGTAFCRHDEAKVMVPVALHTIKYVCQCYVTP